MPHLMRSALHRCLQRHGISRLPATEGDTPQKKKFKSSPIGYFHIDIAEVHTEEGKLYLFVAIDRTSKFAYAELHAEAIKTVAAQFLRHLLASVPDKLHTVLTDHGIQFTNRKQDKYACTHIFARVCDEHAIAQRLTTTNHPWTNGQVERMNRTLQEATVKTYDYQTHQHLKEHLHAFLMAYNFAKRLKTLRGLTPYEYICHCWHKEPERFIMNPYHHTLGLNIESTKGESYQNLMETHLNIQRRLYDDQFSLARTPAAFEQAHQDFMATYNTTAHQGLLNDRFDPPIPLMVLGETKGRTYSVEELNRHFAHDLFPRTTNPYGCVTLHHYRFYVEQGLPTTPVLLWLSGDQLRAVFDNVVVAEYRCRYDWRRRHVTDIRDGVFYRTRYASPQGALIPITPHDSQVLYRPPSGRRRRPQPVPAQQLWLFEWIPSA